MKKNILFWGMILFGLAAFAQDETTNLSKYWHYRYRLVNYYMVVGDGPGMSLPADIRNSYSGITHGSDELRWGETPIYLGYYIGVLATEYRLLKDNHQNTDRTLTELYYALLAERRLDNVAETDRPWLGAPSLNGFLIRDDVPEGFVENHPSLNLHLNNGLSAGSGAPGIVASTHSDYIENFSSAQPANISLSQDITYQLLLGYALVAKFLDSGELQFFDYVSGNQLQIDLKNMAADEVKLIVGHIQENNLNLLDVNLRHWVLVDPIGNSVPVGWDCHWFAYPLAKTANFITGFNYNDIFSDGPNYLKWQALQYSNIITCDEIANQGDAYNMAMVLAAMSNSWVDENFLNNDTPDQILKNGDYDNGGIPHICRHDENHFGFDVFYGAIWDVLYGGTRYISDLCKARDILNQAPPNGPYYHNQSDNPFTLNPNITGWCSSRRFYQTPPAQNEGQSSSFAGNYNGLDYMLLFNLYYLDSKQRQQQSANASPFYVPDEGFSNQYPYTACENCYDERHVIYFTNGSSSNPALVDYPLYPLVYNSLTISASNPWASDPGNLTIKAGSQGVLFTNTSVEYGAYLNVTSNCEGAQANWYFDPSMYHHLIKPNSSTDEIVSSDISLFPNPSSSSFTIAFPPLQTADHSVQIYDAQGKLVYEIKNNTDQNLTVDVSTLQNGLYIVKVTNGNEVCTKRFIRQ